jgi:hypothetical protein
MQSGFSPLFFIGVIENNVDARLEGRVQVRAFGYHGTIKDIPTEDLPWATLIYGDHTLDSRIPPLNAWVFGFFLDGREAQQPMILGIIPTQILENIDPRGKGGWGAIAADNYDRRMFGSRPQELGISQLGNLATGEFLSETYNSTLEANRVTNIPIAGGGQGIQYTPGGNSNAWTADVNEIDEGLSSQRVSIVIPSEQALYSALRERGLSDAAAKGIIANMIHESRLNPGINEKKPMIPGSRGGYGLIQWTGTRRTALEAEAQRLNVPVSDINFQLDYLVNELKTTEIQSYNRMLQTNDPVKAAEIFYAYNLRPSVEGKIVDANTRVKNFPRTARYTDAIRLANTNFDLSSPSDGSQLLEDPSQPDRVEQARLDELAESKRERADQIRTRITQLESLIQELGVGGVLPPEETEQKIRELKQEIEELEKELETLEPVATTNSQAGQPYQGYMDRSSTPTSTWSEPNSAYNARYPFNRVIRTASGHSIELDDTPGGERIMIWHQSGSYIQISNSSTTHKNTGDSYNIHENNHHIYVKGTNIVTIDGDSYVLVKGNKVEEIQGDYRQIVHGNIQIGAARSLEINGAENAYIRSASLGLDSNVENLNIRTSQNIVFESGDLISLKSRNIVLNAEESASLIGQEGIFLQSNQNMHMKAGGSIFINPEQNLYVRADGGTISMQTIGSIRMNAGTFTSIKSNSTMDLESGSYLTIKADASININADGLISLKSVSTFIDSKEGDLNVTGENIAITANSNLNMKSEVMKLGGTDNTQIKSNTNINIEAPIVYIDDEVQLASGATAEAPEDALVKEPIEPAVYSGDLDGFDIAPEADSAPDGSTAIPAASPIYGPAAPPSGSFSSSELIPGPRLELPVQQNQTSFA